MRSFASGFFMNQCPPSPRVFHLDRFTFFGKFGEISASQSAPPVSTTPVANLLPVSTTPAANLPPVSTTPAANLPPASTAPAANCHQYQQHRRRQIFLPVSLVLLIPVANLPPVSMIPAANCHWCQRCWWQIATGINDTGSKFATGVKDTGGK